MKGISFPYLCRFVNGKAKASTFFEEAGYACTLDMYTMIIYIIAYARRHCHTRVDGF